MAAFLLVILGLLLISLIGALFTLESDPGRVDEQEARRAGNR